MSDARVLLVDDDPSTTWFLGRCLLRSGFQVATTGDGRRALALLQERAFDHLVTDVRLPSLNGLALLDWVAEHRPAMGVVVMSGLGGAAVRQLATRKRAAVFLDKPVDPDLLVELLRTPETSGGFTGIVNDVGLFDYVQLVILSRYRTVLEVVSGDQERGILFFEQGRVRHAECGEVVGEQAFYDCMKFAGGSFRTMPWRDPVCDSVELPGEYLLMEAARRQDEGACGGPLEAAAVPRSLPAPAPAPKASGLMTRVRPEGGAVPRVSAEKAVNGPEDEPDLLGWDDLGT